MRFRTCQNTSTNAQQDFWRLIWEQDVRVIVMLTAEMEGNQRKAHPYWAAGEYGPMHIKALSEKRIALNPPTSAASKLKRAQIGSPLERPPVTRRRGVTNPLGLSAALQETNSPDPGGPNSEAEIPQVLVRKLAIHHSNRPFEPLREITQLHFSQWPDLGAIAAQDVLGLVEQSNNVIRVVQQQQQQQQQQTQSQAPPTAAPANPILPASPSDRPILVHCSAGCGRTGTFCTVDSVIDMLKRQWLARRKRTVQRDDSDSGHASSSSGGGAGAGNDVAMQIDEPDWIHDDSTDLIAKAVQDFRLQRLSMVQTLRQYVLCYESVLEWWVRQHPEVYAKDHMRRSSQG